MFKPINHIITPKNFLGFCRKKHKPVSTETLLMYIFWLERPPYATTIAYNVALWDGSWDKSVKYYRRHPLRYELIGYCEHKFDPQEIDNFINQILKYQETHYKEF